MSENKPGLGRLLAHGACCGIPLLILLALQAPVVLLFGGGLVVLGGLVFSFNRGLSRRRCYRELVAERQARNKSLSGGNPRFLLSRGKESTGREGSAQNGRRLVHQKTS